MNRKALLERITAEIRACRKCRLWKTRRNAVPGEGPADARIMLIGQAPGREEDRLGRPFVGMAGRFLDKLLASVGLPREKLFIAAPVKCFPPRNRKPKRDELAACRSYLKKQLALIKPKLIVILGDVALQWFFSGLTLNAARRKRLSWNGSTCIATFHPAAGMRFPKIRRMMSKDFNKIGEVALRYM